MTPQPDGQLGAETSLRDEVAPAALPSLVQRIFGRSLMDLAILLLVTIVLTGLREPGGLLSDPDLWWHVASGRIVDQTHHFIHIEPFSFTVAGQPWIDPEWLSGLIYWLAYLLEHTPGWSIARQEGEGRYRSVLFARTIPLVSAQAQSR
jgi:hypothetical protein